MTSNKLAIALVLVAVIAVTLPASGSAQSRRRECPIICTADFKPVCATFSNGSKRAYSNSCQSSLAACQKDLSIVKTTSGQC